MKNSNFIFTTIVAVITFSGTYSMQAFGKDTEAKTIEIHAKKFSYIPVEITLHKGEPYRLHLTSDDVPHSLRIKELNLNFKMKHGEYNDILFTPETIGNFKADCGLYCGSGHAKMFITVHVVDK